MSEPGLIVLLILIIAVGMLMFYYFLDKHGYWGSQPEKHIAQNLVADAPRQENMYVLKYRALPSKISIYGCAYDILYFDNTLDVDINGNRGLFGQYVFLEKQLRVYRNDRGSYEIWTTVFHELIHGIIKESGVRKDHISCSDIGMLSYGMARALIESQIMEADDA